MEIDLAKTYERSRVPLYLQVASALRRRIQRGNWKVGDKISTLEELETEFQVARVTLRKAIDLLQTDGILDCRQGRGTFVS
ncbi:MAG: GntR family transcriptional regulator, partial [Gammaproteobacteria bacterium]|nr:GntR family transcriptional regulator [Gammaproteobacteria bacterium]